MVALVRLLVLFSVLTEILKRFAIFSRSPPRGRGTIVQSRAQIFAAEP